jgi:hypothetical protein
MLGDWDLPCGFIPDVISGHDRVAWTDEKLTRIFEEGSPKETGKSIK